MNRGIVFRAERPDGALIEMVETSRDYTVREMDRTGRITSQVNGYSLQSGARELSRFLKAQRFERRVDYRQTVDKL